MNRLAVNQTTGFLESSSPNRKSFDSQKKLLLLELAMRTAKEGNLPELPKLCEACNVSISSFWAHYNSDAEFHDQYDEVLRHCEHTLANVMFERGKRPGGFMDRIAWLKRHFHEWRDDSRQQISLDLGQIKKVIDAAPTYIDADLVAETPKPGIISTPGPLKPPQ